MGDYAQGAAALLDVLPIDTRVFGAHRSEPPGAPEMAVRDIEDLASALQAIREGELDGTGFYPVTYRVNSRATLLAEPRWLQRWTPRASEAD